MTLDDARAVIEHAWNTPAKLVPWEHVARAAEVIARETGAVYLPGQARAAPADQRGTASGYDAAARRASEPYHALGAGALNARAARTRYRAPVEVEIDLPDAPPPGWCRT